MLEKLKVLKTKSILTFIFTAIVLIIAYKVIMNIEDVVGAVKTAIRWLVNLLMPFIVGGAVAYLLNPIVNFFEDKVYGRIKKISKIKTVLSIITVYLIVGAMVVIILNTLIPLLVKNITDIVAQLPRYFNKLMEFRNGDWNHSVLGKLVFNAIATVESEINTFTSNNKLTALNPAITEIIGGVMSVTGTVINCVFGIIISVYFILEKDNLKHGVNRIMHAFMKPDRADKLGTYINEAHGIFSNYIVGKIVDSVIIGVIALAGFLIMHVENSALCSVIIGVTNMIPYFGPFIGGIPVVLLVIFESPLKAVWVGLFIFAVQQFDGIILGPKIIGESIDLSPFWIIFSIVVGGGLFGIIGMLLGAPLLAVIFLAVNRLLNRKIAEKESEVDSIENSISE